MMGKRSKRPADRNLISTPDGSRASDLKHYDELAVGILLVGFAYLTALALGPLRLGIGVFVLIAIPSAHVTSDAADIASTIFCLLIVAPLYLLLRRISAERDELKQRLEKK